MIESAVGTLASMEIVNLAFVCAIRDGLEKVALRKYAIAKTELAISQQRRAFVKITGEESDAKFQSVMIVAVREANANPVVSANAKKDGLVADVRKHFARSPARMAVVALHQICALAKITGADQTAKDMDPKRRFVH